jgi:hypothetical protein
MDNTQKPVATDGATNQRAKYITLAVLLLWVGAVFVVTVLKFAKVL